MTDKTVILRASGHAYKVQRTLLTNALAWFKAKISELRDGEELEVDIHNTELEVFEHFLYFLFHGFVPFATSPSLEKCQSQHRMAFCLWVFGEKHVLPKLQNQAMKRLTWLCALDIPQAAILLEAYESSTPDGMLRLCVTDIVVSGLRLKYGYLNNPVHTFRKSWSR